MNDRLLRGAMTEAAMKAAPIIEQAGFPPGTQGYNRVLANAVDMAQANRVLGERFLANLDIVVAGKGTIEAIAKARTESYFNPQTNEWEYDTERVKDYQALYASERAQAGMYDYGGYFE